MIKSLKKLLENQNVQVIFDVGANVGQTAVKFRRGFNDAKIFCFEPFEEAYTKLVENSQSLGLIETFNLAVSNKSDRSPFYFNKSNVTNSLLPISPEAKTFVPPDMVEPLGCLYVDTTTLNDFCLMRGIKEIQILKMDIQGGELMALQGATNLLKDFCIDVIYTEVLFAKHYEGQAFFRDIRNFLNSYGYIFYGLDHVVYSISEKGSKFLTWGDAIFISPKIVKSVTSDIAISLE